MISPEILDLIQCALSKDKHIIMNPIAMSCGHSVCKNCVPSEVHQRIKCLNCSELNENDLDKSKESLAAKRLFKLHINELFVLIEEKFENALIQLKDSNKSFEDLVNTKIHTMKDQIEMRIKSLKSELDKIQEEMIRELMKCKDTMMREKSIPVETKKYELKLNELKNDIARNQNKTENKFNEYQKEMLKMNEFIEDSLKNDFELKFNVSELKLDYKCVGDIQFTIGEQRIVEQFNPNVFVQLVERMKTKLFKVININESATDVCALADDHLLVTSFDNGCLTMYDKHFKLVKIIDKINNQPISAFSATTNALDKLYICDYINNRIIMTDLQLNFIKYSSINSSILSRPHGLHYYNEHVYVCDPSNRRIHKFNSSLDQHTSYQLDICPWNIKITNSIACIRNSTSSITFYDLPAFTPRFKYDGHGGDCFAFHNYFIEYSSPKRLFYVYDHYGKMIEKILTDGFNGLIHTTDDYHGMTYFNGSLVLSTRQSKKLIVI